MRRFAIMSAIDLQDWGWPGASVEDAQESEIGRVLREDRRRLRVMTARGMRLAAHRGKAFQGAHVLPQVGDWVRLSKDRETESLAQMVETLPRTSEIARRSGQGAQIIAANVDEAWLLVDSSRTAGTPTLERYLIAIEESGAAARLILGKTDVNPNWQTLADQLREHFADLHVLAVSALKGDGMQALAATLRARSTYCVMGESGAGKSTLVNRLAGRDIARTGDVRGRDRKGRHVTTHRELFQLPSGALFIDTPGMRELVPALRAGARPKRFDRIFEIARDCRFADCAHQHEPGCAVRQAIEDGRLPASLLKSYSLLASSASAPPEARTSARMRSHRSSSTD